jgi:hypothetical protein
MLRCIVRPVRDENGFASAVHLQSEPMRHTFVLACISAFIAGPVHGQAARDALSESSKCAGITGSPERLKCFDTAVQRAKDALGEQPAKEDDFGKPPPPRTNEIAQITATVLELARTARGRAVFILDNGQTWRQLDADGTEVRDPAPGKVLNVTIAKGVLGSYNLTLEGRNALIKVRRLK